MCSRGSSQPGSRAKCMPMVKVPLGVLRTASISASLMSNVTSGPERSGSAAGVAAPPQIMTNHSTRTARTANMPLRIVLLPRGVFTAQKQKGAPIPLPRHEEDCPNAPSAPGAMRQPVTIVPILGSISAPRVPDNLWVRHSTHSGVPCQGRGGVSGGAVARILAV